MSTAITCGAMALLSGSQGDYHVLNAVCGEAAGGWYVNKKRTQSAIVVVVVYVSLMGDNAGSIALYRLREGTLCCFA
jgi:hypothetical protein